LGTSRLKDSKKNFFCSLKEISEYLYFSMMYQWIEKTLHKMKNLFIHKIFLMLKILQICLAFFIFKKTISPKKLLSIRWLFLDNVTSSKIIKNGPFDRLSKLLRTLSSPLFEIMKVHLLFFSQEVFSLSNLVQKNIFSLSFIL